MQASATNAAAIRFYRQHFNVGRVVLPRVLSMHQVKQLAQTDVGLEVFAFGSLCIMAEGAATSPPTDRRESQHRRRLFTGPFRALGRDPRPRNPASTRC